MSKRESRSPCPISTMLDVLGDRWSLILVRYMLLGKKRFAEFLDSPEAITTSELTDRLATLEAAGLVERRPYQQRPTRHEYLLTDKGPRPAAGTAGDLPLGQQGAARHLGATRLLHEAEAVVGAH